MEITKYSFILDSWFWKAQIRLHSKMQDLVHPMCSEGPKPWHVLRVWAFCSLESCCRTWIFVGFGASLDFKKWCPIKKTLIGGGL